MLKLTIIGLIIGVANIIPGVSGGTMAVILGVYDRLISSVSNIRTDFKKSVLYLLPIGVGAGLGIVLFSKIIEFTLFNFPMATNMVFIGLIIGSIPMIYGKASESKKGIGSYIAFAVCLAIMLAMRFITPIETGTIITTLSLGNALKLFFAGVLAAGAMIIPGVSGSFIMLLIGTYTSVLTAISDFNIPLLIPVGLGCVVGILGCAKLIEKLFNTYPTPTYCGILGLMLGSIVVIVPSITVNLELFIGAVLMAGAAYLAYWFSKK